MNDMIHPDPPATISVEERFCGPPGMGNGGYVCGRLARSFDGVAEVTLRQPVPLARTLRVHRENGYVLLHDADMLVAEARPAALDLVVPPAPSWAEAEAASSRYAGFGGHAFPGCFVCGPQRGEGDGLRIFAGPVDGHLVAAPWIPDTSLADASGSIRPEFLWASLDCPGYFASPAGSAAAPALLGRMTAMVTPHIRSGDPCIIIGWQITTEGRKHRVGTALFGRDGACYGRALATWIELTDR